MSYTDTTIAPEAGYTYVNYGQVYGTVATALGAHAAWTLADTLDVANGANLFRFWVWKCDAAQSGLDADFYVIFRARITVATGLYDVATGSMGLTMLVAETYDPATKIATKLSVQNQTTSATPAADGSNTTTVTLSSIAAGQMANSPSSIASPISTANLDNSNQTSQRCLVIVAKDVLMVWTIMGSGATSKGIYAGSFIPRMSAADDPSPLAIIRLTEATTGSRAITGSVGAISYTRHPKVSGAGTYYWGGAFYPGLLASSSGDSYQNPGYSSAAELNNNTIATLGGGQAADLYGDMVSRILLGTFSVGGTVGTRGGLRGVLKYARYAPLAAHSAGDTFLVDGKVHAGIGLSSYAVWDTEAL